MADGPQIGDVVTAAFPSRDPQGREQEGLRPAVVVALPDRLGPSRFPLIVLVPFTSYREQPWVDAAPNRYPRFDPGTAGLRSASVALLDQVAAVDIARLRRRRGRLSTEQYKAVHAGLEKMFEANMNVPESRRRRIIGDLLHSKKDDAEFRRSMAILYRFDRELDMPDDPTNDQS